MIERDVNRLCAFDRSPIQSGSLVSGQTARVKRIEVGDIPLGDIARAFGAPPPA